MHRHDTSPFPDHIYSAERIELAKMILQKELRKLLLDLPSDAWLAIDNSMQGWLDGPLKFHLEDASLRDFWDAFAAVIEGIKLKPNFTAWVTAQNVRWSKKTMAIKDLQMTSFLTQLQEIPTIVRRNDIPFAELADLLAKHPEALARQKQLIDEHSNDPSQDVYPIIVQKAKNGLPKVIDGNRRTLKALIYNQATIDAWIGELEGERPLNFWVPVNDMFQLLKIYKDAANRNDQHLQQAVASVLKAHFKASDVARRAYQERIANQTELAQQLFEAAQ
jgi:hypothetical protein